MISAGLVLTKIICTTAGPLTGGGMAFRAAAKFGSTGSAENAGGSLVTGV